LRDEPVRASAWEATSCAALDVVSRNAFPGKVQRDRDRDRGSGIGDQGSRTEDRGSRIEDRGLRIEDRERRINYLLFLFTISALKKKIQQPVFFVILLFEKFMLSNN